MYDGENHENWHSWVIRCEVDLVSRNIGYSMADNILIKKEYTDTVLEYAPGKMIVHVKLTDLLFIVNW